MRRQHFGWWRRATRRTTNARFHHADRLTPGYLPEASHVARSLR